MDGAGCDLGLVRGVRQVNLAGQKGASSFAQLAHRVDSHLSGHLAGADQFLNIPLSVGQDEIVFDVSTAALDDDGDFGAVQA